MQILSTNHELGPNLLLCACAEHETGWVDIQTLVAFDSQ